MATEVGICNAALIRVGKNTIASFTEGTEEANFMSARYATARDELLRDHNWNFAIKRVKLARSSTTPAFGFTYYYAKPSDFIRKVSLHPDSSGYAVDEGKEEGEYFASDAADLYLRYIARITDPNQMPEDFQRALSASLEYDADKGLADMSAAKVDERRARADKLLSKAKSVDSITDTPEPIPAGSWHNARRNWRRGRSGSDW